MNMQVRPRRLLVLLALALGAGILLGVRLMWSAAWIVCALLGGVMAYLLRARRLPVAAGAIVCAFFIGIALCTWHMHPALPPEGSYTVEGTITGEARTRDEDTRIAVYLRDVYLRSEDGTVYAQNKAYWTYWPEEGDERLPLDGQRARFEGKVYHPSAQSNPHGFDFRLYLLQRGVNIGVSGGKGLQLSPEGQTEPASVFLRVKNGILARLNRLLGEDDALAAALLLSVRDSMPDDMAEDFRRAGVAHVLSVSGLHVMILLGLVVTLMNRFSPAQWLVLLLTLLLIVPYCLLVGATAAILRASLLMLYLLLGRVLRRKTDGLTALATAFILILLVRPLELFSAGFQMSFAAVAGLVMLGDRMRHMTRGMRPQWLQRVLRSYGTTLCASVAVALPVAYHYHEVSLVGLVINPFLCYAVSLMLPLFALLLLVSCVSMPLAQGMGMCLAFVSRLITQIVHVSASWRYATLQMPQLPWYAVIAVIGCLILCTRYVGGKKRIKVSLAALLLGVSGLVMALSANRDVRYIQFSMGNADAAVIEDGRTTIVVDAGEDGSDVAEYLLSEGRHANVLILTHLHADHALGLQELLEYNVQIDEIWLSTEAMVTSVSQSCHAALEKAQAQGIPVRRVSAGDTYDTGRVQISVLWPEDGGAVNTADGNDFAMALLLNLDGVKMLHMSDVSGTYEMYAAQPCDVLKVAHHGSSGSTYERFLAVTQPQIALLSCREASDKTMQRLAQTPVMVYDTNTRGALMLSMKDGTVRIRGYLD